VPCLQDRRRIIYTATMIERLQTVARGVVTDFESRHGYPPGINEIVLAGGDHELRLLERELGARVPAQIVTFFEKVTPDLASGPVERLLHRPAESDRLPAQGRGTPIHPLRGYHPRGRDHRV
jgi:hypothetical protein